MPWQLDPMHTQVEFSVKHFGMMTVRGRFNDVKATGTVDPIDPKRSRLEVVIDVLSREAVKIMPGHTVMIDGWGGGAPLEAKVNRIEPSAFTKISALGIEEQRVNVIAVLENPPKPLGDRFEVQAHVVVWRGDALKVPSTAVFHDRDRWAVFAVRNGRARLQHVDVGHRGAADVEITGGIGRGEPVINHPSDQVRDGVRVVAEKT